MVRVGASSSLKMDAEWSRVKKALCISKVERERWGMVVKEQGDIWIFEGGVRRQLSGYRWCWSSPKKKCWTRILSSNWTEKTPTQKLIYQRGPVSSNYNYMPAPFSANHPCNISLHRDRRKLKTWYWMFHLVLLHPLALPVLKLFSVASILSTIFRALFVPRMYLECTIYQRSSFGFSHRKPPLPAFSTWLHSRYTE